MTSVQYPTLCSLEINYERNNSISPVVETAAEAETGDGEAEDK